MTTTPAERGLPELPEYAASLHVQYYRNAPSMRNTDFVETAEFPQGVHRLYTAEQMRAYAIAALSARPLPSDWVAVMTALVRHIETETCTHEETHRGGAIWEICDNCGAQWADDRGGRPEFAWPECVENARSMLAAAPSAPAEGSGQSFRSCTCHTENDKRLCMNKRECVVVTAQTAPEPLARAAVAYMVEHDDGYTNLIHADIVDPAFHAALVANRKRVTPLYASPQPAAEDRQDSVPCGDCDGRGHTDNEYPGSDFQPPEPELCSSCGGSGRWDATTPNPPQPSASVGERARDE